MFIINIDVIQKEEARILLDALQRFSAITMGREKAITEEMIVEAEVACHMLKTSNS